MNKSTNQTLLNPPEKTEFGTVRLVIIQPTSFCNIDCDYCYLPNRLSKHTFTLDLLDPIFQNLFTSNFVNENFTVVWHAGEPLSVPISFYESAFDKINNLNNKFNARNIIVSQGFQTNGTLLNQAWCNLIKQHQVKVGISLDGPAFIHNAHRKTRTGIGTHASTIRGVTLLQNNNIDFHVITVLTQHSLDFPEEIFSFFVENGIKHIGFNVEEIEGIHQTSSLSRIGTGEKYYSFMKHFYELTKSTNGTLKVREFERIKSLIYSGEIVKQGQLSIPFTMINIDANGNFTTFCPELLTMKSPIYGDFILGNVLHDTFESILKTDKFQTINQDIKAGIEMCRSTCEYFSLCGGGAPSNKYFENKSFRSSETMFCKYTKKILTDIILEDIETSLGLSLY
jgi:uncharacterized protein